MDKYMYIYAVRPETTYSQTHFMNQLASPYRQGKATEIVDRIYKYQQAQPALGWLQQLSAGLVRTEGGWQLRIKQFESKPN